MAHKILMVQNREDFPETLKSRLEDEGFEVSSAPDAEHALQSVSSGGPDLVVLDLELPVLEEMEFCRRLRSVAGYPGLPILILGGRGNPADKVLALEHGADDFLTLPCDPPELVARVRALLRRASPLRPSRILRAGAVEMDLDRYLVTVGGAPVRLTSKEFDLLRALMEAAGRVVRREDLLERVWSYTRGSGIESRTLDVHIRSLRKKLGAEAGRILTVRGVGYRLDLSPEWIEFGPVKSGEPL